MLNWLESKLELFLLDLYDDEIISRIENNFFEIDYFKELVHEERFLSIQNDYENDPKKSSLDLWNEIRKSPVNSILYRCVLQFLNFGIKLI